MLTHLKYFTGPVAHCSVSLSSSVKPIGRLVSLLCSSPTRFSKANMDSSDQNAFDKARFATILRNLKRESIPSFASAVRYSGHPSIGTIDIPTTPQPINCRLLSRITCGSFNAVFSILFADGTLWILKVPANGHRQCWDAPASDALTSEVFTMRLIKRQTTIPVPEVFAFDASFENELGCPFILMERIYGKPLPDVWFDMGISRAQREQKRIRSLHGIAEAMAQLNTLTFSQGGSLLFDEEGSVVGIGSSKVVDFETQLAKMRSTDYDNTLAFCQIGSFSDPRSYLLSLVDAREGNCKRGIVEQGAYKLLRLLIEWCLIEDISSGQEKPFVLAHPDLDGQNIIVNDDGSLAGIIDWDGSAAVPHCIGSQSLPKFLTRDYDPGNYASEDCAVDSPAELTCYRAMYAQFIESYLSRNDRVNLAKSRRHAAHVRRSRKEAACTTRRSLITSTLYLATKVPSEMQRLIVHLFNELEQLTAAEWNEESSTDDSEEGGSEDGDTEATELDSNDTVGENSSIRNAGQEGREVGIESLSIDELVDEIEALTGMSKGGNSNHQDMQNPVDLEEAIPEERKTEPDFEVQSHSTVEHTRNTPTAGASRVCDWVHKKLRRGAKTLHRKPSVNHLITNAASSSTTEPSKAARTFCGWTERKLRRVARCLHRCDDGGDKSKIDFKIETIRSGGLNILKGLQMKLAQLRLTLCCKGADKLDTFEGSEKKTLQNQQGSSVPKELTRAEKRSICSNFVHMVEDNKVCLTTKQQVAVAHWIIQAVQNADFSDLKSLGRKEELHERDSHIRDGDSTINVGYEGGQEDGVRSGNDGGAHKEDTEESDHRNDGTNKTVSMDQSSANQSPDPSISGKSDQPATAKGQTNLGDVESGA